MMNLDLERRRAMIAVARAGQNYAALVATKPAVPELLGASVAARRFIRARPSWSRLLLLLLATDAIFFIAFSIKMAALPVKPLAHLNEGGLGTWLALAIFGRTAFFYVLAGMFGQVGRWTGVNATMRDTLAGLVWGAVTAAPIAIALALLASALWVLQGTFPILDSRLFVVLPHWLSIMSFFWFTAVGVATAHGVTRITPYLAICCVMTCLCTVGAAVAIAAIEWL